jgi:hypothetical protein
MWSKKATSTNDIDVINNTATSTYALTRIMGQNSKAIEKPISSRFGIGYCNI